MFVETRGRVIAAGYGPILELGTTFESALEVLVRSHRPIVQVGIQRS
ncbi:hypothetical protein [Alloactinosynnema sp. L-07]|nr:hypothetical protein [Alloactinosynnema sp. L-07]